MSIELYEIEEPLEKILEKLQDDEFVSEKNLKPAGLQEEVRITVENLEVWAGNHRFDNDPEDYDIGKNEGQSVRAYFQEGLINRDYDFVPELYEKFSQKLEGERQEYLERINSYRKDEEKEPFRMDDSGRILPND